MICVTGGSGFFGNALVRALLRYGFSVRVLDLGPVDGDLQNKVDFRRVDICDQNAVKESLAGCGVVYHNAAVIPISKAGADFWNINEKGTANVLDGAYRAGAKRFIHYSTSQSLFGLSPILPVTEDTPQNPFGDYGKSKAAAEKICREYRSRGMNISIIRPRTILGAGRLGIFQILFEWVRKGSPVYIIGSGQNKLQFVGLDDMVEISLVLLERGNYEDFNVGTEHFGTLKNDLEDLIKHAGTGSYIKSVPALLAKPVLAALDLLNLSPLVDLHYKTIDRDFYFDITKVKKNLGWRSKESNLAALIKGYDWYVDHARELLNSVGTTHRQGVKRGIFSFFR